jgi:hypothetical protein
VHNGLAGLLAKSILEVGAIVLGQEITSDRLTTVLVDSLEDLVTGGVSQTREERNELSSDRSGSLVFEDDLVQLPGTRDLKIEVSIICSCAGIEMDGCFLHETGCSSIASQWCRPYGGVSEYFEVLSRHSMEPIANVGLRTGWKTASSAIPAEPIEACQHDPIYA